jgi:hypothetical protein
MSIQWLHDSTHYHEESRCFYKIVKGVWMHVFDDGFSSKSKSLYDGDASPYDLIVRPQTAQWSGPQDGLPPVGMRVMVHECTHDYTKKFNGQTVRIVAHDEGQYAVFAADHFIYHALVAEKFKLPPTAQQLAAEQRETAIREIMDVAGIDCLVTATRLVDAGFKR